MLASAGKLNRDDVQFSKPLSLDFIHNLESLEDDLILIPSAIMEKGNIPFERTLYGYFLGDRLAFPFVKDRFLELWKEHGLCDVFINDDDVFFFNFDNDVGMNYVLQKGIWKIKDGLSLIGRKLGNPLEVDSYTSTMCERATGRAIYARILIEMSVNDYLAKDIKIKAFTAKGATCSTQRVEYSWLPKRCTHCKIFGHDHANCPACVTSNSGPDHTANTPIQKTTMPIPKEVDIECFHTVKRRTRASHFPKKKVQVDNHKCKGLALKIAQVYKPIVRDPRKKNVSTKIFDALSHQRVDENVDDPSIPLSSSPETPS
ncbi:unnamed protein product [Lactuca virosa]|uniref:DUF4283 domain-containing protein n=1 Tax=Lactuca virosa TaxID=75947 RepID=A0AAU9P0J6_9ASTR|nr:unnamed protein product [Lactuca virosa]